MILFDHKMNREIKQTTQNVPKANTKKLNFEGEAEKPGRIQRVLINNSFFGAKKIASGETNDVISIFHTARNLIISAEIWCNLYR